MLGLSPQTGAQVLRHIAGQPVLPLAAPNYNVFTFTNGAWSPGIPTLANGEAAFFYVPYGSVPASKVWSGAANGNWDLGVTTNWMSASSPATYADGDTVTFDDSATSFFDVFLMAAVQPVSVTVSNSAHDYTFTGSGKITGTTALTKNGAGVLTIANANDYTCATIVNNGALVVNGSLLGGGAVIVAAGGTLCGTGAITGPVTVQAGACMDDDGGVLIWELSDGRSLTISNTLTLAGTAVMGIDKAGGTNNQVRGITTLTYGGTLVVTNYAGTLAAGDSFKLFDASNYVGSFATISPATPGIGIWWDASYLPVDGTLRVATAPTNTTRVAIQAGAFSITFQSQPGYTYDIEYKNSLTDPSWNVLLSVVASTELTTVWDSPLQQSCRFYRVVCQGIIPEPATSFEPPTPPITSPGASCGAAQDDSMPYCSPANSTTR